MTATESHTPTTTRRSICLGLAAFPLVSHAQAGLRPEPDAEMITACYHIVDLERQAQGLTARDDEAYETALRDIEAQQVVLIEKVIAHVAATPEAHRARALAVQAMVKDMATPEKQLYPVDRLAASLVRDLAA